MKPILGRRAAGLLFAAGVAALLAGCATSVYENRFFERQVKAYPLANGQQLSLGFKAPPTTASCDLIAESSESFTTASLAGTFKMDKGIGVLRDRAIARANERPQDGINHATLFIPNQYEFAGLPLSDIGGLVGGNQARIAYYRCTNPPQPN